MGTGSRLRCGKLIVLLEARGAAELTPGEVSGDARSGLISLRISSCTSFTVLLDFHAYAFSECTADVSQSSRLAPITLGDVQDQDIISNVHKGADIAVGESWSIYQW